jgi:hypothetical protein
VPGHRELSPLVANKVVLLLVRDGSGLAGRPRQGLVPNADKSHQLRRRAGSGRREYTHSLRFGLRAWDQKRMLGGRSDLAPGGPPNRAGLHHRLQWHRP